MRRKIGVQRLLQAERGQGIGEGSSSKFVSGPTQCQTPSCHPLATFQLWVSLSTQRSEVLGVQVQNQSYVWALCPKYWSRRFVDYGVRRLAIQILSRQVAQQWLLDRAHGAWVRLSLRGIGLCPPTVISQGKMLGNMVMRECTLLLLDCVTSRQMEVSK